MKERWQQQQLRCRWALNQNIKSYINTCDVLCRQRRSCD